MTPFGELTSLLASTITALVSAPGGIFRTPEFATLIVTLKIIGGITTGFFILGILYLIIIDRKIGDTADEVHKFITADPINDKK